MTMNVPSTSLDSSKTGQLSQEDGEQVFVRMDRASGQAYGKNPGKVEPQTTGGFYVTQIHH
jgi:hypothetical protein